MQNCISRGGKLTVKAFTANESYLKQWSEYFLQDLYYLIHCKLVPFCILHLMLIGTVFFSFLFSPFRCMAFNSLTSEQIFIQGNTWTACTFLRPEPLQAVLQQQTFRLFQIDFKDGNASGYGFLCCCDVLLAVRIVM